MNPRLEKLRQEREKLAEKLTSLTARLKALDEQILKLENTDIVGIVRENGLTIEQLAALMAMLEKRPTAALPDEYRKTEDFVDEKLMEIFCRDAGRRALHDGLFRYGLCRRRRYGRFDNGRPDHGNPNCNHTAGEYEYR